MSKEAIFFPLYGLTDLEQAKALTVADGTVNFYPDGEGYLTNYPGKADFFNRSVPDQGTTDILSTPPPAGTMNYTRVSSFVDYLGIDHLVVVKGNQLIEIIGNGFKVLYTFTGLLENGNAYPEIFIHESKLIIVNPDDYPLVWDGVDGVTTLGVQETPTPPSVRMCQPWPEVFNHSGSSAVIVIMRAYMVASTRFASGASNYGPYHMKQWFMLADAGNIGSAHDGHGIPHSGTTTRAASNGNKIDGQYQWCVQYFDKYGNKGRPSAASALYTIKERDPNYMWHQTWPLVTWEPIVSDEHITGTIVGRTLTMNVNDASPLGRRGVYFEEYTQNNVTQHRYTSKDPDEVLAAGSLLDVSCTPPPNSATGCSFAGRVFLVDRDNADVKYSDVGFFGQFRASNSFNAYSDVVALVNSGDRLFVIGETSTEVLYSSQAGISLLEQDIENGSSWGRSFVSVGDGAIFGLWKRGFGYYDGVNHKYVDAPYFIQKEYMDNVDFTHSAIVAGDWYLLSIRRLDTSTSSHNNIILMYHMKSNAWYIVEDSINDIHFWNDEILGVGNDLSILFRGSSYPVSRIKTAGFTPSAVSNQFTISDIRILMEPSSNSTYTIVVGGEERRNVDEGEGVSHPLKNSMGVKLNAVLEPHWNHSAEDWDEGQQWLAPGDFWSNPTMDKPITAFHHTIDVTFPSGFPVKVKGFAATYSNPQRGTGQKGKK